MVTLWKLNVEGEMHKGRRGEAFVEFVMFYLIWVVVIQDQLTKSLKTVYSYML